MLTKVAPDYPQDDPEVITFVLARWDRTARLCAIRLSETAPTVIALLWLILRR
jgi:hypothetical protein